MSETIKLGNGATVTIESKEERIARLERDGFIIRDCAGCEIFFVNPDSFAPRHKASARCESGKRSHCTCDVCF